MLLYAVEKMRKAQQEYSKRKSSSNHQNARKWELLVDEYIKEKRDETTLQMQPHGDERRTA
jgi:hypothetical protein